MHVTYKYYSNCPIAVIICISKSFIYWNGFDFRFVAYLSGFRALIPLVSNVSPPCVAFHRSLMQFSAWNRVQRHRDAVHDEASEIFFFLDNNYSCYSLIYQSYVNRWMCRDEDRQTSQCCDQRQRSRKKSSWAYVSEIERTEHVDHVFMSLHKYMCCEVRCGVCTFCSHIKWMSSTKSCNLEEFWLKEGTAREWERE